MYVHFVSRPQQTYESVKRVYLDKKNEHTFIYHYRSWQFYPDASHTARRTGVVTIHRRRGADRGDPAARVSSRALSTTMTRSLLLCAREKVNSPPWCAYTRYTRLRGRHRNLPRALARNSTARGSTICFMRRNSPYEISTRCATVRRVLPATGPRPSRADTSIRPFFALRTRKTRCFVTSSSHSPPALRPCVAECDARCRDRSALARPTGEYVGGPRSGRVGHTLRRSRADRVAPCRIARFRHNDLFTYSRCFRTRIRIRRHRISTRRNPTAILRTVPEP